MRWVATAMLAAVAMSGCLSPREIGDDLDRAMRTLPSWPLKAPTTPELYVDEYQWNVTSATVRRGDETVLVDGAQRDAIVAEALHILLEVERPEPDGAPLAADPSALPGGDWVRLTFLTPYGVPLPHLNADDPQFSYAFFLFDRSDASHGHPVLCAERHDQCAQYASERNFQDLLPLAASAER